MKLFAPILLGMLMLIGFTAEAVPLKVLFQDVKLPTQRVLERQLFAGPLASNTTYIVNSAAGATSAAAADLTTFTHQPDVPRNLEITPSGNTANVGTCTLTMSGTNINNGSITEDFSFSSGSGVKVTGSKAFKTITKAHWAASCEASTYNVNWNIGIGEKLGLKRCLDNAGDIGWSVYNYAKEATAPTIASNVSSVESNTADFNGTMDGVKNLILYYTQNYKCF